MTSSESSSNLSPPLLSYYAHLNLSLFFFLLKVIVIVIVIIILRASIFVLQLLLLHGLFVVVHPDLENLSLHTHI